MPTSTRTSSTSQLPHHNFHIPITSSFDRQDYYSDTTSIMQNSMQQNMSQGPQSLQPSYATGGPVQPQPSQYISMPPAPVRPSSGAWTPADDATLMSARAQGLNWAPIQAAYFPNKTPNACRKRHERLMDRRNSDDWDVIKLETLAKEYMGMRREIWAPLAARTGEKWSVVEAKCMSSGLKNLQSAARACNRRERLESGSGSSAASSMLAHHDPHNPGAYTDDSGIGIDDLDAEYSAESSGYSPDTDASGAGGARLVASGATGYETHHHPHPHAVQQLSHHHQQHQHHMMQDQARAMGGHVQRPPYGMQQRVSSIDMGIGSIINRAPGGGGN